MTELPNLHCKGGTEALLKWQTVYCCSEVA